MSQGNNGNVNGYFNNPNNNGNDIGFNRSANVERLANQLCDKFRDEEHKSFSFYCMVGYKLSEASIWRNFEKATTDEKVKNPAGLFNWLCRKEMNRV